MVVIVVIRLREKIKKHLGRKKRMLVGKDHVGGTGSCWWDKIMLVGKDHVGGRGSCCLWRIVSFAEF